MKNLDGVIGLYTKNEEIIKLSTIGDVESLKKLWKTHANFIDFSFTDINKRTPLHLAASNGHFNVV